MQEIWSVIGYRKVDFVDEKTKRDVSGYTIFLVRDSADQRVLGQICDKIFISSEYVNYVPEIGDSVILLYNKYGKVGAVQVV